MTGTETFSKNAIGYVGIPLVFFALLIVGLYYLFYVPKETELATTTAEMSAAREDAAVARQRAAEMEAISAARLAQISDLENLLSEARETGAALEASIRARESELELARRMQSDLVDALQREVASGQIRVERMLDSLRVDMVNEILFDSGEAELKPAGMEVLTRLGEVLEQATDRLVVVQGHTDSVQIGSRLAQLYPTNWELSAARAVNVTRFLQEQAGLDPRRLSAVGFSEYRPREDNDTPEGRQMNRRIEILLAPLPETSFANPVSLGEAL